MTSQIIIDNRDRELLIRVFNEVKDHKDNKPYRKKIEVILDGLVNRTGLTLFKEDTELVIVLLEQSIECGEAASPRTTLAGQSQQRSEKAQKRNLITQIKTVHPHGQQEHNAEKRSVSKINLFV